MERETAVNRLNELLQGELSAVETYQQALEKADQHSKEDIQRIQEDHLAAVDVLETHIRELGSSPARSSGAWGTWSQTVTGSARLFGEEGAVTALRAGEEYGKRLYQHAYQDRHVPEGTKQVIREILIPNQQDHIATLDRLRHDA